MLKLQDLMSLFYRLNLFFSFFPHLSISNSNFQSPFFEYDHKKYIKIKNLKDRNSIVHLFYQLIGRKQRRNKKKKKISRNRIITIKRLRIKIEYLDQHRLSFLRQVIQTIQHEKYKKLKKKIVDDNLLVFGLFLSQVIIQTCFFGSTMSCMLYIYCMISEKSRALLIQYSRDLQFAWGVVTIRGAKSKIKPAFLQFLLRKNLQYLHFQYIQYDIQDLSDKPSDKFICQINPQLHFQYIQHDFWDFLDKPSDKSI
eukprot:TRINITY_DN6602_c1_g1_i1.p1 TRINITY_DN6602_c1_g1~~TRINITY_DN6602_c1_g1_i1.p1  ORF type:complete len:254 (+),score=-4.72 TRINITY_DN6602_c1_g1_i1:596-1357(+)